MRSIHSCEGPAYTHIHVGVCDLSANVEKGDNRKVSELHREIPVIALVMSLLHLGIEIAQREIEVKLT